LDFPKGDEYSPKLNLDALSDWLEDIEINNSGKIVIFRHFNTIDKKLATELLDVFYCCARWHMFFGNRLIILAQVDDSEYSTDKVGGIFVSWNSKEFLLSSRRFT
jgi:hypothetical protein